jgi:hypothetical protein
MPDDPTRPPPNRSVDPAPQSSGFVIWHKVKQILLKPVIWAKRKRGGPSGPSGGGGH